MTFQGEPTRTANTMLKTLVVGVIIWIAYWAATGGLDRIEAAEPPATTSTTVAE